MTGVGVVSIEIYWRGRWWRRLTVTRCWSDTSLLETMLMILLRPNTIGLLTINTTHQGVREHRQILKGAKQKAPENLDV